MAANYFHTKGSNIAIKTATTVDQIIIESEGGIMKATGVKVINNDGSVTKFEARNEIIVSAGAYCSPALLKRSGIGPKAELASHLIECKIDLPGVGENLMDHVVGFLVPIFSYC